MTQSRPLRSTNKPIPAILAYQNDPVIRRYSANYGVSLEYAQNCFAAFKKYMIVCAVKPGQSAVSETIDEMWHTFLLFTKDYKAFCEEYLGRFIHHEPLTYPTPAVYSETRAFAEKLFGTIDEALWPLEAKTECGGVYSDDCEQ